MAWSPTPTDTFQTGTGWNTTTTISRQPVPGWTSAPQPVYAFADATISVTADGLLVMKGSAPAAVSPAATSTPTAASVGDAALLGEGTVAFSTAASTADATVSPTADGIAAISTDHGLPYTIPFVLGGAVVLSVYTNADAAVSPVASAAVNAVVDAQADFVILAAADTSSHISGGGLPYEIPFTLA